MNDDIEYILELLEDAINDKDWDVVKEAQECLEDLKKNLNSRCSSYEE